MIIQETGLLLPTDTIAVNIDDFDSGKEKKLLIIGYCGSGKSTWAEFLSTHMSKPVNKKYPLRKPPIKIFSTDDLFKRLHKQKNEKGKVIESKVRTILFKSLKDNKPFIYEGIDLIFMYDNRAYKKLILSNPMIILGHSAIIAGIRAGIRNVRQGNELAQLYKMPEINIKIIMKTLNQLRKDVHNRASVKIEKYKIPRLK